MILHELEFAFEIWKHITVLKMQGIIWHPKKFNVCPPPPPIFFIQFYTYHFLIFANELFDHSDFAFILSCKMTEKTNQASILFFY